MEGYNHKKIEEKWQKFWKENKIFEVDETSKKDPLYILDMFPYPSGDGLHVGHPRGYIASDIISHYYRMKGYNVLHPMGWDSFGLPAENYAIKTGIHPEVSIEKNIERFKNQLNMIGLSYDWSREIRTSDPNYYKWTQWIFLLLFNKGLAYQSNLPINWCPSCKTGLANEEVVGGKCERCGTETTKKNINQWILKITDYAQELLDGLGKLDWPERIKEMQKNWIGRSEGADISFRIKGGKERIKVFTTRPDTIFGATFIVLAPEHELIEKITVSEKLSEVNKYVEESKKKLDIERQIEAKEKTGVFTGSYALNPVNGEEIPIWVADYVLPHYSYGCIMAVPAHDQRDYEFAKKFGLKIQKVISSKEDIYEGEGKLINSGEFNGMNSSEAKLKIIELLKEKKQGQPAINYKLRDWIFSRQRYWGEPIPLVFCQNCKKKIEGKSYEKGTFSKGELLNPGWISLDEKDLPLVLPKAEKYQPTGTGESPLANIPEWVETTCPKCGSKALRETNTMPQWAGSCWYFIRYLDPNNEKEIADKKLMRRWLPVNLYIGGAEHAVLHLLYSRFWIKALFNFKIVKFDEPFVKYRNLGLILAPGGEKMSKSKGNVINPDNIIEEYGADTFRLYEMFMGPFDQPITWDSQGILGVKRFLDKVWKVVEELKEKSSSGKENQKLKKKLHQTIKKVTEDIEEQRFNTAVSSLMEYINEVQDSKNIVSKKEILIFLKLLSPFVPHFSDEMYHILDQGEFFSVLQLKWPEYDSELLKEEEFSLIIQINGKVRENLLIKKGVSEEEAKEIALNSEKIKKWIKGKKIKKTIFVPDRLINFVLN